MVQMRREIARFNETLAIVQSLRDGDDGDATFRAFETYRNSLMPYLKEEQRKQEQATIEALRQETQRVYRVRPLVDTRQGDLSKLKRRLNKIKNSGYRSWRT
jgi:hypothetical protein